MPQSNASMHRFMLECGSMESQSVLDRRSAAMSSDAVPQAPFRSAAVLGAGVMGAQIAAHFANAGLRVLLLDIASPQGPKNGIVGAAFKKLSKLKPAPFVTASAARRVTVGNFDEDLHRIKDADWIIEAVVENMGIKRQLMERIEAHASDEAVITTNTSGLPIHQIAQERSPEFRRRFLGTHFFNPPRYLRLFEVIPTPDTDPTILQRVSHFARISLGKGVVVAKDRPNFIGNRIGVYAMNLSMWTMLEEGYSIEEIDLLTGTLIGHPKSATFRTADVVGLDTMTYVSENLYKAVPEDESRETFRIPEQVKKLIEAGSLGAKVKKGFYRKVGKDILSVDFDSLEYGPAAPIRLEGVDEIRSIGDLGQRLRALYREPGRAGSFFRSTTLKMLAYASRRLPEISDNPADVDRAVCWGFAWEAGPFQVWDMLGFKAVLADLRAAGETIPAWVDEMEANGVESFYRGRGEKAEVFLPIGRYAPDPQPQDEISLKVIGSDPANVVWSNEEAALLDLGEGVLCYEFRSKANSLGRRVMGGIHEALEVVESGDWAGMVIGNDGRNFSVGANLAEAAMAAAEGRFELIEEGIRRFQETIQRIRYASKPVVAALHSQVLGGAVEMSMSCAQTVAAAETYMGLVELGAGLIPAGTGATRMTARAAQSAANEFPNEVQPFLAKAFQAIGTAKVATSAHEAVEIGYLDSSARIIMNAQRRLFAAREEALRLSRQGYAPPPVADSIYVLGRPGRSALEIAVRSMLQAGYASEYDRFLASKLAYVMTGGELTGPALVHEDYLLELEREVMLSLFGQRKTQERIKHILTTNKPLRN